MHWSVSRNFSNLINNIEDSDYSISSTDSEHVSLIAEVHSETSST